MIETSDTYEGITKQANVSFHTFGEHSVQIVYQSREAVTLRYSLKPSLSLKLMLFTVLGFFHVILF